MPTDDQVYAACIAVGNIISVKLMRRALSAAENCIDFDFKARVIRRLRRSPEFKIVTSGKTMVPISVNSTYQVELVSGQWRVWARVIRKGMPVGPVRWIKISSTDILGEIRSRAPRTLTMREREMENDC